MAPVLTPEVEVAIPSDIGGNGKDRGNGRGYGGGGDGRPQPRKRRVPGHTYRDGMLITLAAVTMMFVALTSAVVVRRGAGNDWRHTSLPPLVYWNTVVLLASSVTLELCRKRLQRAPAAGASMPSDAGRWLYVTAGLGALFVAGQLTAWHLLRARGVFLATNPSSSFFYLLTGTHGLHLVGGVLALLYLVFRTPHMAPSRARTSVEVAAMYWHFMDGLWIYILLLMIARL